jgi:hypothetical protein
MKIKSTIIPELILAKNQITRFFRKRMQNLGFIMIF